MILLRSFEIVLGILIYAEWESLSGFSEYEYKTNG